MYDTDSGRLKAPTIGTDGDGTPWWADADQPDCSCSPERCLDACTAQGCRGYIREINEASGMRWEFDPDSCPKMSR